MGIRSAILRIVIGFCLAYAYAACGMVDTSQLITLESKIFAGVLLGAAGAWVAGPIVWFINCVLEGIRSTPQAPPTPSC